MRVHAYGAKRSWHGGLTRKHFYDLRTGTWSINELFAGGVFPDGVACRLVDPFTRSTVAESSRAGRSEPSAVPSVAVTLAQAIAVLDSVKSAYADYELDARMLLAYPALVDPQDPVSARWFEAFEQACALEPEDVHRCPPDHQQQFIDAVLAAEKTWEAAEANARAVALDHLDADQRNRIRRARRALDLAMDPATPAGEREAALSTALDLIHGIVTLPKATRSTLRRAIQRPGEPQVGTGPQGP